MLSKLSFTKVILIPTYLSNKAYLLPSILTKGFCVKLLSPLDLSSTILNSSGTEGLRTIVDSERKKHGKLKNKNFNLIGLI